MIGIYVSLGGLVAFLAWRNYAAFRAERDGQWHPNGLDTMRRWDGRQWVYRDTTQEEHDDELSRRAW